MKLLTNPYIVPEHLIKIQDKMLSFHNIIMSFSKLYVALRNLFHHQINCYIKFSYYVHDTYKTTYFSAINN